MFNEWARDWHVPQAALDDLRIRMNTAYRMLLSDAPVPDHLEASVQKAVRLEAAEAGWLLWRNNKGAYTDERGNFIRYGVCNETKALGAAFRSSDLIGGRPVVITAAMVGSTILQLAGVEVKKQGWVYKGDTHEKGQLNFNNLINANGGFAKFINNTGQLS